MARTIVHIPAQPRATTVSATENTRLRTAAYCRVSTEQEEQLNSYEAQVDYYTHYIKTNPKYIFVGIYADRGITGTNTRHRDDFNRMIEDCEAGKIDFIIAKSVSRFARNTEDCLFYTRKLKDLGIGIYFEKENINTLDGGGELLLTILSSLAQEESRNISENCKWGIRKKFRDGKLHLNANRFLGYDKDEKGKLVINKEQAAIVRRVFYEYIWEGLNPDAIARRLQAEGVPGCMGQPRWAVSTIQVMLQNEKYMGDALLQKTYTPDFLNKRAIKNKGEVEQVRVKGDHEPIIEPEIWDAVQLELQRRHRYTEEHNIRFRGRNSDVQPFSCKVICGVCGTPFWRRTWYRNHRPIKVWQCGKRYQEKGVVTCSSENLKEETLYNAFVVAWNAIVNNRQGLLPEWEETMQKGNALERLRAQQMIELTAGTRLTAIDLSLVGKCLDYVVVNNGGILAFHFLDGSQICVETEAE